MAEVVKFDPNTGKPLAEGQTVMFEGRAYTGGSTAIGGTTTTSKTYTQGDKYYSPTGQYQGIVNYDANTGTKLSSGQTTTQYTPTSLKAPAPIAPLPQPTTNNLADTSVAGATQYSQQLGTQFDTKVNTEQTAYDKLSKEIEGLMSTTTGRGAEQLKQEQQAGIPQMQQQLQGINSQIQTKLAEFKVVQDQYAQTIQYQEGKPIPMDNIIGRTAEINRSLALQKNSFASDIGLLQAQAQGLQGQLELAQNTADRAVDLKYQDATTLLNVKLAQLDLIKDRLNSAESKQAAELEMQYRRELDQMDIQKAGEKDLNATLLNAMQNYPDAGISLTDTLEQANAKIVSNSKIYLDEIRGPSTGSSSTTLKAPTAYQIQSGDTLYNIAKKLGITLEALLSVNGAVDPNNLRPGQIINLPTKTTTSSSSGVGFDDL